MTRLLNSLNQIADCFDVAVLDQWGVLHDGTHPYPGAGECLRHLHALGKEVVVLSNSGKRAALNRRRIARIGLPVEFLDAVITSGEALWQDLTRDRLTVKGHPLRTLFPLCSAPDDARIWAEGAPHLHFAPELDKTVDALLLMGVPDGSPAGMHDALFHEALLLDLPCLCSNPDRLGVRAGGTVLSPGQLAERYEAQGGTVIWYGKPWPAVFESVRRLRPELPPGRFLMVGDSLEHDIAGGAGAGFQTAFIRGGIHAPAFAHSPDPLATLTQLVGQMGTTPPTYSLATLA
jgi:HAD superfamily hydrolase (TIGR01459 family)